MYHTDAKLSYLCMRIILIVLVMMLSMHGHFEARCAVLSDNSVVTTYDIT